MRSCRASLAMGAAILSCGAFAQVVSFPPVNPGQPGTGTAITAAVPSLTPAAAAAPVGFLGLDKICDAGGIEARPAPVIERVDIDSAGGADGVFGLHDEIRISLTNAAMLRQCLAASHVDPILFIDHVPLSDLRPKQRQVTGAGALELVYRIDPPATKNAGWTELYLRAWNQRPQANPATIGIGPAPAIESASYGLVFQAGPAHRAWTAVAGGACLLALVLLGLLSDILRDRSPAAASAASGDTRSFSLARTLMLAWMLTTFAAIGLVLLNTGAVPSLDGGVPLLLVANGAMLGSSTAIDLVRKTSFGTSRCVWTDLVADNDGLAVHRLQAVAVNVLLLAIVWHDLYAKGSIAELDKGWSALMGISSGIYLYGKASEPNAPTVPLVAPIVN